MFTVSHADTVLKPTRYTDIGFAIGWVLTVVAFMGLGFANLKLPHSSSHTPDVQDNSVLKIFSQWAIWVQLVLAIFTGFGLVAAFLKLLKRNAEFVVNATVYFGWLIFLVLAGVFAGVAFTLGPSSRKNDPTAEATAMIGYVTAGTCLVMALYAALTAMLAVCCWREHLKITTTLLQCAAQVFDERLFSAMSISICSAVLGMVFWGFWIVATHGVLQLCGWKPYEDHKDDRTDLPLGPACGCMFVMFWSFGVLSNTVHIAYCKMVGCWYYLTSEQYKESVSPCKFYLHAWTNHIGSVCFGSLIVAVISTLRWLARVLEEKNNDERRRDDGGNAGRIIKAILLRIIVCLLSMIEEIADFINRIAYVHVAIKNEGFIASAKSVYKNFCNSEGLRLVLQNTLVNTVLRTCMMVFILFSLLITFLIGRAVYLGSSLGAIPIYFGFFFAFIVTLVVVSDAINMLDSGVLALFVLYSEDSVKLRQSQPVLFQEMESRRSLCQREAAEGGRKGGYTTYA